MAYKFELVPWFAKGRQIHIAKRFHCGTEVMWQSKKESFERAQSNRKWNFSQAASSIDTIRNTIVYELQMKRTNQPKKGKNKREIGVCMCVCFSFLLSSHSKR